MEVLRFHWRCLRLAGSDLRSFAREHIFGALIALVVSLPAIPLAARLGSSLTQELWGMAIQTVIGPALLIAAAFVVFWVRAPFKLWRKAEEELETLRADNEGPSGPSSRFKVSKVEIHPSRKPGEAGHVIISVKNRGEIRANAPTLTAIAFVADIVVSDDDIDEVASKVVADSLIGVAIPEGLEVEAGDEISNPTPIPIVETAEALKGPDRILHVVAVLQFRDASTPKGKVWITEHAVRRDDLRGEWTYFHGHNRTYLRTIA